LKKELPKGRRLQPGPAGNVVMATVVGDDGRPNIITLGMYMPISLNPPLACIGVAPRRYSHHQVREGRGQVG
jgi:flavin reductase (DIM6/NTAB) family NADH-FMN oxidoreductase RutF